MPDVLKYLIVDDEEIDRLAIESEAEKYPFFKRIASCPHPLQAVEIIRNHPPDILFADIEMPDITGLELVKMFPAIPMMLVFITSHPEFAVDGFELEALDYLVKPLSSDRFARCVGRLRLFHELRDKAVAFDKEQEEGYIVIKEGHEKHRLRIQDILFLEAMKDYTRIQLSGKQFLVLMPFMNMLDKMPAGKFVRIHRSFSVNLDKITDVGGGKVHIEQTSFPIGKLYKHALDGKF